MLARSRPSDSDSAPGPALRGTAPGLPLAALPGVLGHVVQALADYTDAPTGALAVSVLAHWAARFGLLGLVDTGDGLHTARVFALLIGEPGAARKTTAAGLVSELFERVDARMSEAWQWPALAASTGLHGPVSPLALVSGEQVLNLLHQTGRAMVYLPEFGRLLISAERGGNSVAYLLREALDGHAMHGQKSGRSQVIPWAHVAGVSCCTPDDLRTALATSPELAALLSRLVPVHVTRSRTMPDPLWPDPDFFDIQAGLIVSHVAALVGPTPFLATDKPRARIGFDSSAAALWFEVFDRIADKEQGGRLTGRMHTHCKMVAALLALINARWTIEKEHLEAAEIWTRNARLAWEILDPPAVELTHEEKMEIERIEKLQMQILSLLERNGGEMRVSRIASQVGRSAGLNASEILDFAKRWAWTAGAPVEIEFDGYDGTRGRKGYILRLSTDSA